jgi:uncharacterized membrane protein YeaQ/YmgE (transglycosylase-associated protein family)
MINTIMWLLAGGIVGGLANLVVGVAPRRQILVNISVAVVGALLGGLLLIPYVDLPIHGNAVNYAGILVAGAGAVMLLVIVNLLSNRPSTY